MMAGRKVADKIHAQRMPAPMVTPKPVMAVMGEVTMVRKAAEVVMEVRNTGSMSWFIVRVTALRTSLCFLASLKNRDRICTPSEFAMVRRTMGIEVFTMVK